ncbi:MAG: hypothetical protein GX107_07505 [Clostridiales bacterium]|jgi:hypothetical protein|nr:hypothetical protein [Clostridiales bacterium]
MSISFDGFKEKTLTFKAAAGFDTAGVPVIVSAGNTVNECGIGDSFCGISKSFRNGLAAVQLSGIVTIGYSGTAPSAGYNNLACNGAGKVSVASEGGREYLIVDVNTTKSTVTFLL